ncbi:very short patch repair endonuclease [Hoyosella altamirensis]|uniref:Very short patch repair endonuclease n=1 Tax=Hoyosella altamirensis TaxID=616997 RepID=A0A839RHW6_9ACTN|nr:very short patch repair endonuclease [Hoyosella altamirensis]MBB3035756.1 DNA mismatch endonuclease (patch repair protein) [Hoyosella altamirensis]
MDPVNGLIAPTPGRSRNMAAIKRAGTQPERLVRSALHRMGYRFRKDLPIRTGGMLIRPDIVFTKAHVAVFIDGCFWHCCPDHGTKPRTNSAYWSPKLARNADRDRRQKQALESAGWTVLRVWEHASVEEACASVVSALRCEGTRTIPAPSGERS